MTPQAKTTFVLTLLILCLSVRPSAAAEGNELNIVSIVTDDQALWSLSCFGSEESLTPNLDSIATEGARFVNAFTATPVCSPRRATFFTGRYGTQLGITDFISQPEDERGVGLRPGTVTWPAVLQHHGYTTMLSGKWHLGRAPAAQPLHFGFDRFYGFLGSGTLPMAPVFDFPDGRRKLTGCTADVISSVDIFPSVLGLLGVEVPRDWKHEGSNFSPLLRGQVRPKRDTLFSQYDLHNHGFAQMRAARNAHWKLVRHFESHLLDEFYDLSADPSENYDLLHWGSLHNLTTTQKQAHAELDAKLHAWMESIGDPLLQKH